MICKIALAVLSIVLLMAASTAIADSRSICQQSLSVTEKPVFAGLKATKFDAEGGVSTEGGEYQVFSNSRGSPIYVVASQYGETGKKVALYRLLDGSARSYSVRISHYYYTEPIYSGAVKIAQIETSNFIVCNNVVARGVGSNGVSQNLVKAAGEILFRGIEAYNSRTDQRGGGN